MLTLVALGCSRCGSQREKQPQEPNEVSDGRVWLKAVPSLGAARPKKLKFNLSLGVREPWMVHSILCHFFPGGEAVSVLGDPQGPPTCAMKFLI